MTLGTIWAREGFVLGTAALRRVMNFGTKRTSDHRLTRRLSDCCDGCTNSVEAFEWFALKLGCWDRTRLVSIVAHPKETCPTSSYLQILSRFWLQYVMLYILSEIRIDFQGRPEPIVTCQGFAWQHLWIPRLRSFLVWFSAVVCLPQMVETHYFTPYCFCKTMQKQPIYFLLFLSSLNWSVLDVSWDVLLVWDSSIRVNGRTSKNCIPYQEKE